MKRLFLILMALSCSAFGTNYFVSKAGNDANAGTSSGASWKTIAKVNTLACNQGDTVSFNKGDTWNLATDAALVPACSGASGNPVTFTAYGTGAAPVLDGQGTVGNAVSINGRNFITISNLDIRRVTGYLVLCNNANSCRIQNNTLSDAVTHGINILGTSSSATIQANTYSLSAAFPMIGVAIRCESTVGPNCTASGNTIDLSNVLATGTNHPSGIVVFQTNSPVITNNVITMKQGVQGVGLKASGSGNLDGAIITGNSIVGLSQGTACGATCDAEAIELTGSDATHLVTNALVSRNYVKNDAALVSSDCVGAVWANAATVTYNFCILPTGSLTNSAMHWSSTTTNFLIYGNSIFGSVNGIESIGTTVTGMMIKNNIIHSAGRGIFYATGSTGTYANNTVYNSSIAAFTAGTDGGNNVTTNPLFAVTPPTSPSDMKLQTGSPAIGQGADLGATYISANDPAGSVFPFATINQSTAWTRGAFAYAASGTTGILADNRVMDWSLAGVTGGIPSRTTICSTLNPGATAAQINSAIAACPANQVVFLNAGTYALTAGIDFNQKNNVTLRGAGANQTILNFSGNPSTVNCNGFQSLICVRGDNRSGSNPLTVANVTGASQYVTSVTLSSTSGLVVGQTMVIDRLNDSNTDPLNVWICETVGVCAGEGPSGGGRSGRMQSQIVTVTAIAGSVVSFQPRLQMPNWNAGTPQAWWVAVTPTGDGVEDLSLDGTNSTETSGILLFSAHNSWVRGIRSIKMNRNHIWLFQTAHVTIRDSYFYETESHGSQSYGVEPFQASDNLVENNIFQAVAAPITVNGSGTGNVYGYNFMVNDAWFAGNLSAGIWLHSAGVDFNLLEGNIAPAFFSDLIHGTHHFVTAFRNQFLGRELALSSQTNAILLAPDGRYFNLVGNVVGVSGYHNSYSACTGTAVFNIGCSQGGIGADALTGTSLLRWGNYDTVNAATRFLASEVPTADPHFPNTTPASQTLPSSFYLGSKPSWWGNTLPWPGIGPDITGGSVSGVGGHVYPSPAMACFQSMGGPANGVSAVLSFSAASCYAAAAAGPQASLSPSSLTFAGQLVGSNSASQSITLTNTGTATLNISNIALTGANFNQFNTTQTCGPTLAASASCTVSVTFSPTSTGAKTAAVTFTDDATGSPQSVPLTGTGTAPGVNLSPASLAFGVVVVSTSSASQPITLTNNGTGTLSITSIAITGTDLSQFSKTQTCGATLAASASCTVNLTFSPTGTGAKSAAVTFTDSATTSPQTVSLSGTGATVGSGVSPSTLAFGNQTSGSSSASQDTTFSNTGTTTINISSITITGTNSNQFSKTQTCGSTLAPSVDCTVSVTFSPTSAGAKSASVTFTSDAPGSPQNVGLTGTGVVPVASPAPSSLTFGNQLISTSSAAQVITLTNTGLGTMNISGITITGTNANQFSKSQTCGSTLAPSGNCTVSVTFSPTTTGAKSAAISFADDAAGSAQTVSLSGTGTAPGAALTPSSLLFGNQGITLSSAPQTLTLTNSGTATLNIASILITGADAAHFSKTQTCIAVLAPSAACTVSVTFTPATLGAKSASVAVTDDASGSPHSSTLSGTGIAVTNPPSTIKGGVILGGQLQ